MAEGRGSGGGGGGGGGHRGARTWKLGQKKTPPGRRQTSNSPPSCWKVYQPANMALVSAEIGQAFTLSAKDGSAAAAPERAAMVTAM